MTLSDLVCIISPTSNFPVVISQIAKDYLSCMITVRPLCDLNLDTDLLIFFLIFFLQIFQVKDHFFLLQQFKQNQSEERLHAIGKDLSFTQFCISVFELLFSHLVHFVLSKVIKTHNNQKIKFLCTSSSSREVGFEVQKCFLCMQSFITAMNQIVKLSLYKSQDGEMIKEDFFVQLSGQNFYSPTC